MAQSSPNFSFQAWNSRSSRDRLAQLATARTAATASRTFILSEHADTGNHRSTSFTLTLLGKSFLKVRTEAIDEPTLLYFLSVLMYNRETSSYQPPLTCWFVSVDYEDWLNPLLVIWSRFTEEFLYTQVCIW